MEPLREPRKLLSKFYTQEHSTQGHYVNTVSTTPDAASKHERYLAYQREYRAKNKDSLDAYQAEYRKANREKISERYKANPDAHLEHNHRNRAKRAGTGGNITVAEMAEHRKLYGQFCAGCGVKAKDVKGGRLHIDHIMPFAKDGQHIISNIQFLCGPCNSEKADRDPIEWIEWRRSHRKRSPIAP